jgi:hypothetical protein
MTSSNARQVEGREGRAGPSSTLRSFLRPIAKRQKLDHREQNTTSKFFPGDVSPHKRALAVPSTSKSVHPNLATTDAISVDGEDDSHVTNDDPHDLIVVGTSSPDPIDILPPGASYTFDQNKPSPMNQFSASLEEKRKSPQDGASTQRVRQMMKKHVSRRLESTSRVDGDDAQSGRLLSGRSQSTARAEVTYRPGNVKSKVAFFDEQDKRDRRDRRDSPPHVDLRKMQSRKNGMKPKQVGLLSYSVAPATK